MEKKIPIKSLYTLLVISLGLIALGVGSTYAVFTASTVITNPIIFTSNLTYNSNTIDTIEVDIDPGDTNVTELNITNDNSTTTNYIVWYDYEGSDIEIFTSLGTSTGTLAAGESTTVEITINNHNSGNVTIIIGVSSGSDSIVLDNNMKVIPS